MSDEQIKKELENPDSDACQALKEYKTFLDNVDADDPQTKDYSPSDENVKLVRKIAKNANELKTTLNTISEKREQIQKDFGAELDDDAMDAILYQQLSIQDTQDRIERINMELQQITDFDVTKQKQNTSKKLIAKYGSLESLRTEKEKLLKQKQALMNIIDYDQVEELEDKQERYEKSLDENGKETDESADLRLTQSEKIKLAQANFFKSKIEDIDKKLTRMEDEDKALAKAIEHRIQENRTDDMLETVENTPVLTEQDIMEMDAASRAYILNPKNRNKYSEKQQEVIDAINSKAEAVHFRDWQKKLQDVARLQQ